MSSLKNSTLLLMILASAIVAVSCGRSAQSYVERGNDYYQKGKYADAAPIFASVKGGSPATPRVASLWADFSKMKAAPPAAAAAAQ